MIKNPAKCYPADYMSQFKLMFSPLPVHDEQR